MGFALATSSRRAMARRFAVSSAALLFAGNPTQPRNRTSNSNGGQVASPAHRSNESNNKRVGSLQVECEKSCAGAGRQRNIVVKTPRFHFIFLVMGLPAPGNLRFLPDSAASCSRGRRAGPPFQRTSHCPGRPIYKPPLTSPQQSPHTSSISPRPPPCTAARCTLSSERVTS